jgi:hypothetical protein
MIAGLVDGRRVRLGAVGASMAFSPDGSRAVHSSAGGLQLVQTDGTGSSRAVMVSSAAGSIQGVTWTSDSTIVVGVRGALTRVSLNSARIDSILLPATEGEGFTQPAVITSRYLLARRGALGPQATGDIGIVDMNTNSFRPLGVRGVRPQYVDPGVVVYMRDGEVWGLPVHPRTLDRAGSERRIISATTSSIVRMFAVSRNGFMLVRRVARAQGGVRRLAIVDRAGRRVLERDANGDFRSVRFSPDGEQILFSNAQQGASSGADIYVLTLRDGGLLRLTSDSVNLAPEWSPDGRTVYFARQNARLNASRRQADIVRVPAQGGAEPVVVLERVNQIYEFQLTPDERRILWREDVGGSLRDLLSAPLVKPDSARGERVTRFDERGIALSPDGEWYVYTSDETGTSEIYLSRLGSTGARWPVSRGEGTEPRWTRNGEIFFRRGDTVMVTRPTLGGEPRISPAQKLFVDAFLATGHEPLWDVAPDGKRFALVHDRGATNGMEGHIELMIDWLPRWLGAH